MNHKGTGAQRDPDWYPSDAELDAGVAEAVKLAEKGKALGPCCNCGAVSPFAGRASDGRVFCCIHCCFNPLGCRCEFGEFGKEETKQFFGGEEDELEDCYGD
jgi:hypothetical protein